MADAYPESKAFAPKERSDCRRNKGCALPASSIGLSWVFPMSPGCPRHWCEVLGLGVSRRAHLVEKNAHICHSWPLCLLLRHLLPVLCTPVSLDGFLFQCRHYRLHIKFLRIKSSTATVFVSELIGFG